MGLNLLSLVFYCPLKFHNFRLNGAQSVLTTIGALNWHNNIFSRCRVFLKLMQAVKKFLKTSG